MIIKKFPLILFTIIYAIGILIADSLPYTPRYILMFTFLFCFIVFLIEKRIKNNNTTKTTLVLFLILFMSICINLYRLKEPASTHTSSIRDKVMITKLYFSNNKSQTCVAQSLTTHKKYLAVINKKNTKDYKKGESLYISGKIENLKQVEIPYRFNFYKYLKRKGINNKITISKVYKIKNNSFNPEYISNYIAEKIDASNLSKDSKALLKALTLGEKKEMSGEVIDSFSDTGIMHLLALSGLHIGILTMLLSFLLSPILFLANGNLKRSICIVFLLWAYAYITGLSPSIVRATIMFSIIVIGKGLKRPANIYNSLAIAAIILLCINPNNIFDVGFQLSFSAVIGIAWLYPMMNDFWEPKHIVVKYFWGLILISIVAQISTLPLSLYYFHKFSSLFLVANLIEIPLITLLLMLSYMYIILLFFGIEFVLFTDLFDSIVMLVEYISQYLSTYKGVIFNNIYISKMDVFMLFAIIISITLFFQQRKIKLLYIASLAIIYIQSIYIHNMYITSDKELIMLSKNEVFIQRGNHAYTDFDIGKSDFKHYAFANKIIFEDTVLKHVFFAKNICFLNLNSSANANPITNEKHIVILNNYDASPINIINKNTYAVASRLSNNSFAKNRWEYFCEKKGIVFYNTRDSLFVR